MFQNNASVLEDATLNDGLPARIVGVDIARSMALLGMFIVNFRSIFNAHYGSPEWLLQATDVLYGRSAAVFVMLAGAGISLMADRQARQNAGTALHIVRTRLYKRSLVLLVLGLVLIHWWPPDILHYYSVLLLAGTLMLKVPDRWLWRSSILSVAGASVWQALSAWEYGWPPGNSVSPGSIGFYLSEILVSGYYPLFPWLAFLLTGMWLGRQTVQKRFLNKKILLHSVVAFVSAEFFSGLVFRYSGRVDSFPEDGILCLMLTPEFIPATPLFVISSAASALIVVWSCLAISNGTPNALWIKAMRPVGQLTLSVYVFHIPVAYALYSHLGSDGREISVTASVTAAIVCFFSSAAIACFWRKHLSCGPLEWILRRVSRQPLH